MIRVGNPFYNPEQPLNTTEAEKLSGQYEGVLFTIVESLGNPDDPTVPAFGGTNNPHPYKSTWDSDLGFTWMSLDGILKGGVTYTQIVQKNTGLNLYWDADEKGFVDHWTNDVRKVTTDFTPAANMPLVFIVWKGSTNIVYEVTTSEGTIVYTINVSALTFN